jgi:radical SAM superfamily enzyme YgiQ (UPF0313 family)
MRGRKRVLLINPAWSGIRRQAQWQFKRLWPPLCLANAAALLEREGVRASILDLNVQDIPPAAVARAAREHSMVFLTSTPHDRWQCPSLDIRFFLECAEILPKDRLYIMGSHVTERPAALLAATGAAAAVLGEPEAGILELVQRGGSAPDIPGTAALSTKGLDTAPARKPMEHLEDLPFPAFHLLPMSRYGYSPMGGRFTTLEGSRGCPVGCSFCYLGMHGRKHRKKPPERLVAETEWAAKNFGIRNVYYMDLEFALSRDWTLAVCGGLAGAGAPVSWCCQTRVPDVDAGLLGEMKKAGCRLIHFGVEAGSPRVLAETGKGITAEQAERAVRLCREAGIQSAVFLNFGFPGETPSEMEETVRLALRLNPDYASFHLIVPFPGTRLFRESGIDLDALPPHLYPQYNPEHNLKEMKRVLRGAWLRFYARPRTALRVLASVLGV